VTRAIHVGECLVLSLFPGIGLLDRAFEEEGFCVVRGPDVLWGGDIRRFHPPAGKFDGVIGGPPCKGESTLAHLNGTPGLSMRDEFCRVRDESECAWWVMEAVKRHDDIDTNPLLLTPRWLGSSQSRKRWFHSNLPLRRRGRSV
jgi:DNA (cytosine-5)-methyltransferase 1